MKVKNKISAGSTVFDVVNYALMILVAVLCLLPILNVLAVSLSSSTMAAAGVVLLTASTCTEPGVRFFACSASRIRTRTFAIFSAIVDITVAFPPGCCEFCGILPACS